MLTLTSPIETWLHRVPAGLKLALLCATTIVLFQLDALPILAGVLAIVGGVYLGFGWMFFRYGLQMLRPLLPFVVVVGLWHLWIDDVPGGLAVILRFFTAVAIANLVTMTTRLSDMISVIEGVAQSFAWLGIKPRAVALSIALTIRFIPVLGQKIELINAAWKARSTRRSRWRIFIPVILAVLDDATHVADALRARGGTNQHQATTGE
jgi:biotin transport system permease protein